MQVINLKNLKLLCIVALGLIWTNLHTASACSRPVPMVTIQAWADSALLAEGQACLDPDCQYALETDPSGSVSILVRSHEGSKRRVVYIDRLGSGLVKLSLQPFDIPGATETSSFWTALDHIIESDLSELRTLVEQELVHWRETGDGTGDLHFMPYEESTEAELKAKLDQGTNCFYPEFRRLGPWLASFNRTRDFCVVEEANSSGCPKIVFSYRRYYLGGVERAWQELLNSLW
jgi:hypothetical protein